MTEKTKHATLAAALAAFQASLPKVHKGSTNPHFKSKYAALEDIASVVLPALATQGLAWITRPTIEDGQFVLAYELTHESGQSVSGSYPLGSGNHQALGSAITYARRYCLSAVTGIAPDEDDDGHAASQAVPQQQAPKRRDWNGEVQALVDAGDLAGLRTLADDAKKAGAPDAFMSGVAREISKLEDAEQ